MGAVKSPEEQALCDSPPPPPPSAAEGTQQTIREAAGGKGQEITSLGKKF